MAILLNLPEVLTFDLAKLAFALKPAQALLRGGPTAQPSLGLQKKRPTSGQIWPRSEFQRNRVL